MTPDIASVTAAASAASHDLPATTDYRLSVIGQLATPVWQQTHGLHTAIWWPHLHRILAAVDDLGCAALLP